MKDDLTDQRPPAVPERAKQGGDVRARWAWTEPSVWTDRMLTALEHGVKGGKWFSLIDKVWHPANLQSAWERVKANGGAGGVDHQTVEQFGRRSAEELAAAGQLLRDQRYVPQGIRRAYIPKPGQSERRPLGIPTVRDRVVQTALRQVIEPVFEAHFAAGSYGFRPGRGCKDALRQVDQLLTSGYTWVVDVDIRRYFDTIPHAGLMARVAEQISDGRILALIGQFLRQGVLEHGIWTDPVTGTPQGAGISPLLANIYLNALDHVLATSGYAAIRYADDMVIVCRSALEAERALTVLRTWLTEAGLELHPQKTRLVDMATTGSHFDFLGYRFHRSSRRLSRFPRPSSEQKLRTAVRRGTRRTNGHSLDAIIQRLNPTLRGWFAYFKHSNAYTFPALDGWIRMRLRSILRKRSHRRGRGRGADHQRWPNTFFAEHGLFSLTAAHAHASQSV